MQEINLPKNIKLGPIILSVEFNEHLKDQDNGIAGRISHSKAKIELEEGYDERYTAQTLIHEIIHGLFYACGDRNHADNEELVSRLSTVLLCTLLESDGLLDYLKALSDG